MERLDPDNSKPQGASLVVAISTRLLFSAYVVGVSTTIRASIATTPLLPLATENWVD